MPKQKKQRLEWTRRAAAIGLEEARIRLGAAIRDARRATMVRWRQQLVATPMRQSELARRLGISQKTLGNIEEGSTFPSLPLYIAICREFKLGKIPLVS